MTDLGFEQARGKPLLQRVLREDLDRNDVPTGFKIGPYGPEYSTLSKFDVKCLMLQLAYMESGYDYTLTANNRYGRYLAGTTLLEKYKFIDSTGTWLGKNGIDSAAEFILDYSVQDSLMEEFLEDTYESLSRNSAILPGDSTSIAAGMLAVAYQFQSLANPANKAHEWRKTGATSDDQGRNGYIYFNAGKYAVQVLAADIIG